MPLELVPVPMKQLPWERHYHRSRGDGTVSLVAKCHDPAGSRDQLRLGVFLFRYR